MADDCTFLFVDIDIQSPRAFRAISLTLLRYAWSVEMKLALSVYNASLGRLWLAGGRLGRHPHSV